MIQVVLQTCALAAESEVRVRVVVRVDHEVMLYINHFIMLSWCGRA